jgi:hypothetical protein
MSPELINDNLLELSLPTLIHPDTPRYVGRWFFDHHVEHDRCCRRKGIPGKVSRGTGPKSCDNL